MFSINRSETMEEYYDDKADLYVWRSTSNNCQIYLSELMFINISCFNGVVDNLYLLNETELNETIFRLRVLVGTLYASLIMVDEEFYNLSLDLIYVGIGAQRIESIHNIEYVVENDTLSPVEKTTYRFINPYYKFYLLLNGIRIGYPIQLGYENSNGNRVLKYFKAFIPSMGEQDTYVMFRIDRKYIEEVIELFNNITNSNFSANDIVIGDIYYYPTNDLKHLSPVLIIYANTSDGFINKVVALRLYPDKPVVESIHTVLGHGYVAGDVLYLENYLSKIIVKEPGRTVTLKCCESVVVGLEYLLIPVAGVILSAYLIYRVVKSEKKP